MPDPARPSEARPRIEKFAIAAWILLATVIALRLFFSADPARNNVYLKVFAPAARAFVEQRELYSDSGFRYPPLCAAMFLPFEWCGPRLGSVMWRVLNFGILLLGIAAAARAAFPFALRRAEQAVLLLLVLSLNLGSLNNGQPNPLILGLLLLATTGLLHGRRLGPAAAVAGSTLIKVYPLAYGMVLAALRPRLLLWLVPALVAIALLPFVLSDPGYIAEQYRVLFEKLGAEDRTGDLSDSYRDLRLLLAVIGAPISDLAFLALQAAGGLGIVALCFAVRRRTAAMTEVLHYAFGLTMCWFMLLGPATEQSTYALIAPTLAWGLVLAYRQPGQGQRLLWLLATGLSLLSHLPIARTVQGDQPWIRTPLPLATLLITIALVAAGLQACHRPIHRGRGANAQLSPTFGARDNRSRRAKTEVAEVPRQ